MRVALEARALGRPASGIRTYVTELVAALARVAPTNDYTVLEHGPRWEAVWPWWLNTSVPRWLKGVQPDVVHFTKAAVPFDFAQGKPRIPTVVTIYDVIPILFPESQKLLPRFLWPSVLRHAAHAADHIMTISEASKRDIVERLQVPAEKVTVTRLGVPRFAPSVGGASRGEGIKNTTEPYILFLSTLEPRKNVPALVRAFAKIAGQIPHELHIAGGAYRGVEEIEHEISRLKLHDRIKLLGRVTADQLPALYAGAAVFVLPSIYEGWGFPAQEAMAAGVPVIVSNGGSLPEVVGEAGEVVPFIVDSIAERAHDEGFEAALAERLVVVLTDKNRQARLRQLGLVQAQKFTWDDVARTTLAVYRRVGNL